MKLAFTLCGLFLAGILSKKAEAHPLTQGVLDVVVYPDHVLINARISVEEVTVTNRLTTPGAPPGPWAAMGSAAYEQHAAYLTSHLVVNADGVPSSGGVVRATPPDNPEPTSGDNASYELFYPLPAKAKPPRRVDLRSEVLTDVSAGGVKWVASYVVKIAQVGRPPIEGLLLTSGQPVHFECDWAEHAAAPASADAGPYRLRLFKDYFLHGIHHIFSVQDPGYDHLLFVSALVLGASSLWELFKLVTAFTLAHTITLTLAALGWVHVSERIVEPLIALSIVFVALENVLFPGRSRGWLRLGVAFFFGLFHGLGFAGALLDAMQGMSGAVVLIAILAFSLGVETAHQMVVLPLFTTLRLARQTRTGEARERFARLAQRVGSAAISVAGLFYLVVALRW